jgi:NAD(P)-dependent dehydrogenase (short-subunit alcohol dehydrogenase family)
MAAGGQDESSGTHEEADMGVLDGKVAVVTGASSGSGLGIATRFVAEGASVVLLARGQERLEATAVQLGEGAVPVATDLGDADSVRAAFSEVERRFGKLDILINNAAVYRPCAVEKLSDGDIAGQVATNFLGPVYTSRAAIPLLRAAGGGDIINTSSESTLHPFPMLSMYTSTKAALEMFSRVLAQELRDDDIRVTTVVQGTAAGPGGGSADWGRDPEHAAAAHTMWTERGLLAEVGGRHGGQHVEAIGDVHIFIVTRPRSQRLDVVHVRSF